MDPRGSERSWSNTQHHGPTGAPGPPLDHLDPAWTTSFNHTLEIAAKVDQGGPVGPRGPWNWVLDQEHCGPTFTFC